VEEMNTFFNDIKYAFRQLRKKPGFTIVAVLILALGIGANTALFSIIYNILLSPLRLPDSERLMMIEPQWKDGSLNGSSSGPDYLDWRDRNTCFEGLTALSMGNMNLTKAGDALTVKGFEVTPNFFEVVNDDMALGRGFRENEDLTGNDEVVVLSYALWRDRYGCDPNILNQQVDIDKVPHTVIGVAAAGMTFLDDFTQMYVPIPRQSLTYNRSNHYLIVLGRLKPKISIELAKAQLSQIARQLAEEHPDTNREKGVYVGSLHERLVSGIRVAFYILYGAVTLLLLTACTNISNLLIAHASTRRREMAIRQALGGHRWRLIRQLLTESLLLGLMGCIIGLLFAFFGLDVLLLITPKLQETGTNIPGFSEIEINSSVFYFTLALSLIASLVFGIIPAWQGSGFNLSHTLKETGASQSRGPRRHRTLGTLVVAQVAMACVILAGAGLLLKSFTLLKLRDPGFNPKGLLAIHIERPRSKNTANDMKPAVFFQRATEQLAALHGVESAGAISLRPLSSENNNTGVGVAGKEERVGAETRRVTQDYFHCLGIPILQGRFFSLQDNSENQPVVIVNQDLVRRLLPDRDPIGQQIDFWGQPRTIVGVVGNVTPNSLHTVVYRPFVYVPHTQSEAYGMTLFIRTNRDPMQWAQAVRQVIREIDDNQPILYINKMTQLAMASISLERFCTILIAIMAGVALFMALVGLYAVMAFSINERRSEVGIRMALGAEKINILMLVTRKAFLLTITGLAIGMVIALILSCTMSSMLYSISTWDPATFILVPILLFIIAMLACYIPARKAMKLDPMKVLRYE
jgi:putative ABC transport system permease protein